MTRPVQVPASNSDARKRLEPAVIDEAIRKVAEAAWYEGYSAAASDLLRSAYAGDHEPTDNPWQDPS